MPPLDQDLRQIARRHTLARLGGLGAMLLLEGCGGGDSSSLSIGSATVSSSSSSSSSSSGGSATCSVIPEETAGPYPGDGSNSNASGVANALTLSGIVRSDIRSSVAGASGVADGVPLTITLQLVSTTDGCTPLVGYAIYLWHCTADGLYSLYSSGLTGENFLRGVQVTDSNGTVSFTTIFPGCYSGRMPHMHFEVYPSLAKATGSANKVKTSQIAFPTATCNEVYATSLYTSSKSNFAQISFASDNVFSDGYSTQMATLSGSTNAGYAASLRVGIAA